MPDDHFPLDFFNLDDSRLILSLLYVKLNLVKMGFSSAFLKTQLRRNEVESFVLKQLDYVARVVVNALSAERRCRSPSVL